MAMQLSEVVGTELKFHGTAESEPCNRDGCLGVMQYIRQDDCSCHISPPCSACVYAPLICNSCGADPEDEAEGK